jgi:hypothetical protein
MKRLTDDMFKDATFASYLPLFNIWAIFIPSVESGIGVNGVAKVLPGKFHRTLRLDCIAKALNCAESTLPSRKQRVRRAS